MEPVTESLLKTARKQYIVDQLGRIERIAKDGERIAKTFPKDLREHVDDNDPFNESSRNILRLALAQAGANTRSELLNIVDEAQTYINHDGCDKCPLNENGCQVVDHDDEELLEGIVILLQRLRTFSKKSVLKFLEAVRDGESAELLIVTNRLNVDASYRSTFGLNEKGLTANQ